MVMDFLELNPKHGENRNEHCIEFRLRVAAIDKTLRKIAPAIRKKSKTLLELVSL